MDASERGILSEIELRTVGGRLRYYLVYAVLIVIVLLTFFPIYFAFIGGVLKSTDFYKPGFHLWSANPEWHNYYDSAVKYHLFNQFLNTFIIVVGGVILQMIVSTLIAYSLARLNPLGGKYIMFGILATLMIPSIAYIIPLYKTLIDIPFLHINLVNSYWGVWLPYSLSAITILVLKNFFEKLPGELFDAARIEGATTVDIFLKFILPLSRSIIAVLAMLTFVGLWKDFLLPYLILQNAEMQPISVRLYLITKGQPQNLVMAASFLAMLPPLIIALFLQKIMVRGLFVGAFKG